MKEQDTSYKYTQKIKMATSFKKKGSRGRAVYPLGTKPSLHNNQLLISSGVPSLDNNIGKVIDRGFFFYLNSLEFSPLHQSKRPNDVLKDLYLCLS